MRGKILTVDDEPNLLKLASLLLKKAGYDVDTAADGLEALEKVKRSRPDLILVDVTMPRMDGFTFCETLRKSTATTAIPIIMLTGLHSHLAELNSFAHGANAFLMKPFSGAELLAEISVQMDRRTAVPAKSGSARQT
jgi:DNA-binding response OmpR family regulator